MTLSITVSSKTILSIMILSIMILGKTINSIKDLSLMSLSKTITPSITTLRITASVTLGIIFTLY